MKVESSLASQLYASARNIGAAEQQPATAQKAQGGESFSEALTKTMAELSATLGTSETVARQAMLGQGDVQSVVEALTSAELAFETAVTVRDRVVEAYQEILRMPI